MEVFGTKFPEVMLFRPKYFEDDRGYFCETYNYDKWKQHLNIQGEFLQDNQSFSKYRHTLRGMHFQNYPKQVMKIIRCVQGKILDVIIDIRKGSPTYKEYLMATLSADNRLALLVPAGFAHGFITLTDNVMTMYKMDGVYNQECDRSISWEDPSINIKWPVANPILSDKDKCAPNLDDSDANLVYGEFK